MGGLFGGGGASGSDKRQAQENKERYDDAMQRQAKAYYEQVRVRYEAEWQAKRNELRNSALSYATKKRVGMLREASDLISRQAIENKRRLLEAKKGVGQVNYSEYTSAEQLDEAYGTLKKTSDYWETKSSEWQKEWYGKNDPNYGLKWWEVRDKYNSGLADAYKNDPTWQEYSKYYTPPTAGIKFGGGLLGGSFGGGSFVPDTTNDTTYNTTYDTTPDTDAINKDVSQFGKVEKVEPLEISNSTGLMGILNPNRLEKSKFGVDV